jgi:hypothetical protein
MGYVMSSESSLELISGDGTNFLVRVVVCFPLVGGCSKQLMCRKEDFLMGSALGNLQRLFY